MDNAVGAGSDASAARASVPRLDLSSLVDTPHASATQMHEAMKRALEGEIGGAGSSTLPASTSIETSTTEMPPISIAEENKEEHYLGPSTPPAPSVPATVDTCSICTGNLGENGGTLSLLCGKDLGGGFFFSSLQSQLAAHLGANLFSSHDLSFFPPPFPPKNQTNPNRTEPKATPSAPAASSAGASSPAAARSAASATAATSGRAPPRLSGPPRGRCWRSPAATCSKCWPRSSKG